MTYVGEQVWAEKVNGEIDYCCILVRTDDGEPNRYVHCTCKANIVTSFWKNNCKIHFWNYNGNDKAKACAIKYVWDNIPELKEMFCDKGG